MRIGLLPGGCAADRYHRPRPSPHDPRTWSRPGGPRGRSDRTDGSGSYRYQVGLCLRHRTLRWRV